MWHEREHHSDQRFRDEITLLRLVEHLEYAVQDATLISSASELEQHRCALNSAAMELTQAQEAANRLSDEFIVSLPNLPRTELREPRNIIIHEHGIMNLEELYHTAIDDVPRLLKLLHLLRRLMTGIFALTATIRLSPIHSPMPVLHSSS